jgi:hypothetical protein
MQLNCRNLIISMSQTKVKARLQIQPLRITFYQ